MPPRADCSASLVALFPPEIYNFVGSSTVLPELLQSVDRSALTTVQFLRSGAVRLTFKTPLDCQTVVSEGIQFRGTPLRVMSADARSRLIHLRDCPAEVPDDVVRRFFTTFGEVHAVTRGTHKAFPEFCDGNRVVQMTISKDVPGLVTIAGFECRVWYRRQPAFCAICRKLGHRSKACPLDGLCRRCRRPGHHARDCVSAWAPAADAVPDVPRRRPAEASADAAADVRVDAVPPRPVPAVDPVPSSVPPSPVDASAVRDAEMSDEEYVPPAGADSEVSTDEDEDIADGDDALASGDEEVVAMAVPSSTSEFALGSGDEVVVGTAVSSSASDSPRHRRKIRRCTVSSAVPVRSRLPGMDLSEQESPGHKFFKTFRGVWKDQLSWEEIRASKARYRVRTPMVPPSPALSPPSQTFSASSATPVPPVSPTPSSVSSDGSVVDSVRTPTPGRHKDLQGK